MCTIMYNYEPVDFVIDKDDYEKVKDRYWHLSAESYIASHSNDKKTKMVYLHNLIMGRNEHYGKGVKESVDHINRNGLDNRKENLRILTQSQQNINQNKKKRNITLPTDCGITVDEIPRHIWYVKANGQHGDRFAIEFKTENFVWKTTSLKSVSLKDKLKQATDKLEELYKQYKYLHPDYEKEQIDALNKSFMEIIDNDGTPLES